ncbi:MAG: acyltransferase family protein [Alcanivoracaceae bacterium]|nr:acyltransferase family protein [Alcanivoracaceae bacterium]
MSNTTRFSELDWLRVILILTVFLHHVFMPFNGDGWHIMNLETSKVLDDIMVYFEQLRLQTLFFIAGASSLLLLQKLNAKAFFMSKLHRLFVPLIIGMMLIVPPQNYFENINDYDSLLSAYGQLIFSFDSNHLWFIEFLIVFMIMAVPFKLFLDSNKGNSLIQRLVKLANKKHGLFSIVIALILLRSGIKYAMPSESHQIENLSLSLFFLFFFLMGMCFIKSKSVWQALTTHRKTNLAWLLISSVIFYGYYFPDLSPYLSLEWRWQIWWLVCSLVSWSGLLTIVGYAGVYFEKTPDWLYQTNALIYPFYILHQTAIVVFAFHIVQWQANIAVKSLSLLFSSLLVCAVICYYLIRPFKVTRYLFGLKPQ